VALALLLAQFTNVRVRRWHEEVVKKAGYRRYLRDEMR